DRVRKAEYPKVHVLCFWLADADSMSSVPGFAATGRNGCRSAPIGAALRRPYASPGRAHGVNRHGSRRCAAVLEGGGAGAADHLPAGAVEAAHAVLDVVRDGGPRHVDGAVTSADGE